MTEAQVRALYDNAITAEQARKLKPGAFDARGEFLVAETTILKKKAWATFTFGAHGLADVLVRPDLEDAASCPGLRDALIEKYGEPKEKSEEDSPDLYLVSDAWVLKETRIEFDCSSIRTPAGRAKMKKSAPGAVIPDRLPADALRLHYFRN